MLRFTSVFNYKLSVLCMPSFPMQSCNTHHSEFVTICYVENLSIECHCLLIVEIFPVPNIPYVIFRQSLSLNQFSLWHSRIFSHRLNNSNAVVLKIIVDNNWSNSVKFLRRFMNRLFEVGIVTQHLRNTKILIDTEQLFHVGSVKPIYGISEVINKSK